MKTSFRKVNLKEVKNLIESDFMYSKISDNIDQILALPKKTKNIKLHFLYKLSQLKPNSLLELSHLAKEHNIPLTNLLVDLDKLVKLKISLLRHGFIPNKKHPLVFLSRNKKLSLLDGFHRFFALLSTGIVMVEAEVYCLLVFCILYFNY